MSYSPPAFIPPGTPPKKRSNLALILTIVGVCVLVPCAGIIGAFIWAKGALFDNLAVPLGACVQDFTVVRRGIIEYADDHDGKFPKAETWQDDVRPYVSKLLASPSSNRPFKGITADGQWGCAPAGGAKTWTGMAFNQDLSEKKLADQKTPNETTLIFEIDAPSPNAHQVYKDRGATGPMIFGSHRPWLYLPIKGKSSMSTSTSKTTFGDDSDPFSTAPSKDDSETVKPAKKASDAKGKKKTGDSDDSDSSDRDQGSP